ncbi:MAG: Holliday junction branch migration protein RuvA [Alistipes sp.]|jgi:Holliday junction DNA helicase RuvA|nr:Holliday junction branch migration protein RuvA [Alistipes sp.]MBQ5860869.1 Holliday junction branch migration protein RuvA [Alistipes sp.]MBR6560409.1 Holliday junction branch migration protein RuvA [Alistipes sp.]
MYEYISGSLTELSPTYAVVEAAGVGYYINISLQTFSAIEGAESVRLYVHFIVREDAQILYGFATRQERELFRLLISVSGVGGNTARMILSTYSTSELRNIISTANAVLLKNVKGLGLKTAQKIIVELSGKMVDLGLEAKAVKSAGEVDNEVFNETVAALVMLGFQKGASEKVVKALLKEDPNIQVEDAVRLALRRM